MVKSLIIVIFLFIAQVNYLLAADIIIGTGSNKAIFYPVGSALCSLFNEKQNKYECIAVTSKGSQDNLDNLLSGKINMSISQAALQAEYYKSHKNLRSIFFLHKEHMSILVKQHLKISSLSDLKGKRVNIGNIGSGSRIFVDQILMEQNINYEDFAEMFSAKSGDLVELFCDDKIDAALYFVGHPNQVFKEIIDDCQGELVSMAALESANILELSDRFTPSILPRNLYHNQDYEITSVGLPIILSTRSDIDPEVIATFIKLISLNQDQLLDKHPIFKTIQLSEQNSVLKVAPFIKGKKL